MPSLSERIAARRAAQETGTSPEAGPMDALRARIEERRRAAEEAAATPEAPPGPGLGEASERALQRFEGSDVGPGKDKYVEASRQSAVGLLGMLGAVYGSKLPVAPGPAGIVVNPLAGTMLGGAAGVVAGTFAPEFSLGIAESLGLVEPGTTERIGRPMEERKRMALGEAALDAHFGVFGQLPRMLLGRPVARVSTNPTGAIRRDEIEAIGTGGNVMTGQALAEEAEKKFGITLMPWQVGRSPIARATLAVAGRFPWVGAPARGPVFGSRVRFTSGQRAAEEGALKTIYGTPRKIGEVKGLPELSQVIMSDAKGLLERYQTYFRTQYDRVWDAADNAGVRAELRKTQAKAADILGEMRSRAPQSAAGPSLSESQTQLAAFLETQVLPLDSSQSLRSVDALVTNIDEFTSRLEPKQQRFVLRELNALRNAALEDLTGSVEKLAPNPTATGLPTTTMRTPESMVGMEQAAPVTPGGPTLQGMAQGGQGSYAAVDASAIAARVRELDAEFSDVMKSIFETSTAKKFGAVERRGLRGMTWDPTTSTPLGKLAKSVIDLQDPKAVDELFALVGAKTQKDIAASVVENGMTQAWRETSGAMGEPAIKFDTQAFNQFFGLEAGPNNKNSLAAIGRMLESSGSEITVNDIKLLGRALDAISTTSLPSASSFIARRAQIGGGKAVVAGMMGGLASTAAHGAAGYAAGGLGGMGVGMLVSFVGVRGLIRAMSNPAGAKSFRVAMSSEVGLGVQRANVLRLGRTAWNLMLEDARAAEGVTADDIRELDTMHKEWESGLNAELKLAEDTAGKFRSTTPVPLR